MQSPHSQDIPNLLREVLGNHSNGKIIWQPRIACYFDDRKYRGEDWPEPYSGLSQFDVFRAMRTSNRLYEFNECITYGYNHPSVHDYWHELNELELEHVIETPKGTLRQLFRRNTSNYGSYSTKWLVQTEEEMKILIWLEEQSGYDTLPLKRNYLIIFS
jgi:hypothetical protein